MKKGIIFILLFAFILQISIISPDLITIGQSGGEEMSIGSTFLSTSFTGIPEETTPVTPPVTPPGGGPSGSSGIIEKSFTLNKLFLPLTVKRGEQYQEQIIITNDRTTDLEVNVSITDLERFLFPEEESFTLAAGETKILNFNIYFSENENIDVYLGKIIFKTPIASKFVNVILDVKEKAPLFDIKTTILRKRVSPGKKVTARIEILNLGDLKNIDIELEYKIRDFNNNTYTSKKESFAIVDEFSGKVFLDVPQELQTGEYVFYSKVKYNDIIATSYDTFTVVEIQPLELLTNPLFITIISSLIILVIALFLIIIILKKRHLQEEQPSTSPEEKRPKKHKEIRSFKTTTQKPIKTPETSNKLKKQMFAKLLDDTVKLRKKKE